MGNGMEHGDRGDRGRQQDNRPDLSHYVPAGPNITDNAAANAAANASNRTTVIDSNSNRNQVTGTINFNPIDASRTTATGGNAAITDNSRTTATGGAVYDNTRNTNTANGGAGGAGGDPQSISQSQGGQGGQVNFNPVTKSFLLPSQTENTTIIPPQCGESKSWHANATLIGGGSAETKINQECVAKFVEAQKKAVEAQNHANDCRTGLGWAAMSMEAYDRAVANRGTPGVANAQAWVAKESIVTALQMTRGSCMSETSANIKVEGPPGVVFEAPPPPKPEPPKVEAPPVVHKPPVVHRPPAAHKDDCKDNIKK